MNEVTLTGLVVWTWQAAAAVVNLGGNNRDLKRLLATAGATQVCFSLCT